MEPSATPVMTNPRMPLAVTGSPLHDCWTMAATSAATTTAPAMVRVRSRESACRISVTFNQLLSWPARRGRRWPRRGTLLPPDKGPAVDAHGLARDVGGLLGDQVHAGGGDVVASAHAADGYPAGHHLTRRHGPGRQLLRHHGGVDRRRRDVVDGDAARGELERERLAERDHAALGRRVVGHPPGTALRA